MDILKLFDCLRSEVESDREKAYEAFEELLKNPSLYKILFQILEASDLDEKYYILASECLLNWSKRIENTISEDEQIPFIQKIQSFLLKEHPAQEELWELYIMTFHRYPSKIETHINFLGQSIELISLETPPEILALSLKLSSVTSYKIGNNLIQSNKTLIEQLFTEINNRLIPILQNAQELLTNPIGCSIICYSFKTILYTTKRCQFNEELYPLILEILHLILQGISNISNSEYQSLVGFCEEMISMFAFKSSTLISRNVNLTKEQIDAITEEANSLLLQFVVELAPYHVNVIDKFLKFPNLNSQLIPETPEFVNVLVEIATLTEIDLSDYDTNPAIFYESAYPSRGQSNTRRLIYDLVSAKCHDSKTYEIIHYIISQPPTESVMYLAGATCREAMISDMGDELFQWIAECANQKIPFQSTLLMSTYLYLVSQASFRILSNEFMKSLAPIVYKIVVFSVLDEDSIKNELGDESNSYSAPIEFIKECSKSLVTVSNAIRVARKILDQEASEFPPEMLFSVVKLIPCSLTFDAARFINVFIQKARSFKPNEEKTEFLLSQIDEIKLHLCQSAMSSISSAKEYLETINKSDSSKNEEVKDFEIVANSLQALNEIIICEGEEPNITPEMLELIEALFSNFDVFFANELIELMTTLIKLGFDGIPQIMGFLTEKILSTQSLFYDIDHFFLLYVSFIVFFHDAFVEMEMAPVLSEIGMKVMTTLLKVTNEYDLEKQANIGLDLICFSIQADHNFDVAPIIQFVEEQCQISDDFFNYDGIMIMMSIVISRLEIIQDKNNLKDSILEWVAGNNAKCPYEKRLAALSLIRLSNSEDIMKIVAELLNQEKEQRELMKRASLPPCHDYPTPIDQIEIKESDKNAE